MKTTLVFAAAIVAPWTLDRLLLAAERRGWVDWRRRVLVPLVASLWTMAACHELPGPPDGPQDPACLERARFGDPASSPYRLPYADGTAHEVFQTYCGPVSHGRDGQMAIDFLLPTGTDVLAARGGVVRAVVDHNGNGGRRFNAIWVEHDDGTVAFYGHLQKESAAVEPGERVAAGQLLARSGSSGTSLPHLHFGVASSWPARRPDDMPVNFRDAEGPLDERGGLVRGGIYRARSPGATEP